PPLPASRRSSSVRLPATPTDRPLLLLIISDDHGYGDLSSRGSADARTPHLDRLAAEGMSFDSAYVTAPICSPSRAGLIAGAHQPRWGGHWFSASSVPPAPRPVLPPLRGRGQRRPPALPAPLAGLTGTAGRRLPRRARGEPDVRRRPRGGLRTASDQCVRRPGDRFHGARGRRGRPGGPLLLHGRLQRRA